MQSSGDCTKQKQGKEIKYESEEQKRSAEVNQNPAQ
jgi:hypothetical protein